jgi:short subunit dehydrogenase-like uncharacterized protein
VPRIVVFGASGYTGRLVAAELAAAGAAPVLAGRHQGRLAALAGELGDLEVAVADAARPGTVRALVGPGDVLVSTVGPFLRHGEPAARAAIQAGAAYLDSTGEPPFVRRVFEVLGPLAAGRSGLVTAFGYDFVPGNLAGALALAEAAEGTGTALRGSPVNGAASSIHVGYFVTGPGSFSSGTLVSGAGLLLEPGFAWRGGRLVAERTARRLGAFQVGGRRWLGVSYGGSEHYALPRLAPGLRRVEVYLGWFGRRSRAMQAASAVAGPVARLPGARALGRAATAPLARRTGQGPDEAARRATGSYVVAVAAGPGGEPLAEVRLRGPDPYTLTARLLAWGARRAATAGLDGTGALGPVAAFGLDALQAGSRAAGLERER